MLWATLHPDQPITRMIKFNMKPIPIPPKRTICPTEGKSYITRDGTRVLIKNHTNSVLKAKGYVWNGLTECGKRLTWTASGYYLNTKEIDGMDIVGKEK